MATALLDLAIVATDDIAIFFADTLISELTLNAVRVADTRTAQVNNAQLTLEVTVGDASSTGYYLQSPAYTELIVVLESAFAVVGIPKEVDFQLIDTTQSYIKLNLGYRGNTYLNHASMDALVEAIVSKLAEPATYNTVVNEKILTLDPYFANENYHKVGTNQGVVSYTNLTLSSMPTKVLDFTKIQTTTTPTYVESYYATPAESEPHTLIFSAKAIGAEALLKIVAGDTTADLNVKTGNFGIYTVDFKPKKIELYNSELYFSMHVRPSDLIKTKSHVNFDMIVTARSFRLDEAIPFSLNVRSGYKFFFGLLAPAHVQIAGIWVSKRGVLDTLDDPLASYTPYAPTYNASTSVENPTPFSITNQYSPETTGGSLLSRASNIINQMTNPATIPNLLGLSQIENVMNTYVKSLSGTISSINSLLGGTIPYTNPHGVNINFAAIEASLGDNSLDFLKKNAVQKMVDEMKKLQRSVNKAKDVENKVLKQVQLLEQQFNKVLKANYGAIGTDLKEITQKIGAIDTVAKSAASNLSTINSSANLATKIPSTVSIPGLPSINLGSATSSINKIERQVVSQINTLTPTLTQIQSQVNSALSGLTSFTLPIPTTIQRNNGTRSVAAQNAVTNVTGSTATTTATTTANKSLKVTEAQLLSTANAMSQATRKTLIAGIDYSKYLP